MYMKRNNILKFHIGRATWRDRPTLTFVGESRIDEGDAFDNHLFDHDGVFYDANGNEVGLTVAEAATGIGRIELDGDYDTTYTTRFEDLTEKELNALRRDKRHGIIADFARLQGISDEDIEEAIEEGDISALGIF